MLNLTVTADWAAFRKRLSPGTIEQIVGNGVNQMALDISRKIATESPQHWSTGAKTWFPEMVKRGSLFMVTIRSAVSYIVYPMLGFPAHEIRPRNKKVLAWRSGGAVSAFRASVATLKRGMHFATSVHHPGFKGYHIPERVVTVKVKFWLSRIVRQLTEAIGGR